MITVLLFVNGKTQKNKELTKLYEGLNQVKLMALAFEPNYRKILFTEYTLNANFQNICAARVYESFNLRILRHSAESPNLKLAEYGYYWSSNIVLNYIISELPLNTENRNARLKISIFVIGSDDIIYKFCHDREISAKFLNNKKSNVQTESNSTYHRISGFIKDMYDTDRTICYLTQLCFAFEREANLQYYFYDNPEPFTTCKKSKYLLSKINEYVWEDENRFYINKFEEVNHLNLEEDNNINKYLFGVTNFKLRYKKLLRRTLK